MKSLHVDFPELEKYMVFYCLFKLENNTVGHFLICWFTFVFDFLYST